jgi:gliding motility-associated-like protein
MKKIYALVIIILFSPFLVIGQNMTTSTNLTVTQYVQDVLLGSNVSVSNITYNGASANTVSAQVGGFECPDCNLGILSGFTMTSGDVAGIVGPNNNTGYNGAGGFPTGSEDPDLLDLVQANGGSSTQQWAIIEFDFVPLGDTLSFKYVWGSEEYDSYVGTQFNDVFGFFISGPGINGPYSNNAENIALIPGTNLGVSINNINNGNGNSGPCAYCEYYNQESPNDNYFFNNQEDDIYTNPYYMQYDGYTDVLTAVAYVQCGLTYHIKLAVCDANDTALDSGVFLQRDSFSSNLTVQTSIQFEVGGPNDDTVFENCGTANLVFERPESGDINTEIVAYISYGGTATNGIDFNLLPDSVVFAPGVSTVTIPLDATVDGLTEGIETVTMTIENFAQCAEIPLQSTFSFFVADIAQPLIVDDQTIAICQGAEVLIEPVIQGGYGAYGFVWSNGDNTQTSLVQPDITTEYILTVSDTCGIESTSASFMINVSDFPDFSVTISPDSPAITDCFGGVDLIATAVGGEGTYQYGWEDENGNMLWGWENTLYWSAWNGPGWAIVTATDGCGFQVQDSVPVTVSWDALAVEPINDVYICDGIPVTITPVVTGGVGNIYYNWYDQFFNYLGSGTSQVITGTEGTVTLYMSDDCAGSFNALINIYTAEDNVAIDAPAELTGDCTTLFNLAPIVTGGGGNYTYQWILNGNLLSSDVNYQLQSNQSEIIQFIAVDACGHAAVHDFSIVIIDNPVEIDAGPDVYTTCSATTEISANTIMGVVSTYAWTLGGNSISALQMATVQTMETTELIVNVENVCGQTDTDSVTVFIINTPITLTTSPDTSICADGSANLWVNANGGEGAFMYQWTGTNSTTNVATVSGASAGGIYTVKCTDQCGRFESAFISVDVMPITGSFVAEEIGENYYSFTAVPTPTGQDCSFIWDMGDGTTSTDSSLSYQFDGLAAYTVSLITVNEIGCTDTKYYTVRPVPILYIPNAFTPNNDGLNDIWNISSTSLREYDINIFDRWGNVVFHSNDPKEPWIGNTAEQKSYFVQDGVYNFLIKIKSYDGDSFEKSGFINVTR